MQSMNQTHNSVDKSHYAFIEHAHSSDYVDSGINLSSDQIEFLEKQGSSCLDWTQVFVSANTTIESLRRIRNCMFNGIIYLGVFDACNTLPNKSVVASGLYNSSFYGRCVLGNNCYVFNCCSVGNVLVGQNTCLLQCGYISGPAEGEYTSFGEGSVVTVGPENTTEGTSRKFVLQSSITYGQICRKILSASESNLVSAGQAVRSQMTIIGESAFISQSDIGSSFVGRGTTIKKSTMTTSTVIAAAPSEATSVTISDSRICGSIIHDHCTVDNNVTLDTCLLFAHSSVGTNAHVDHSVLASDSSIAHGECVRSVVGPFVGFHHTSLLIATCWVLGRGNIGYGGMIGANHTGRSNDQQCLLGEGVFVGLSSALKFPFNTLGSPYSILAASTVCLPQKISFPFSLISSQESNLPGQSPALNAIKPGWILWGNPYFIERCMNKFSKRRQSTQYRTDFPIFRPSIVDMVITARDELRALAANGEVQLFSADHCKSLGKCLLTQDDVMKAIDTYTGFIQRYALHGYLFYCILQVCNGGAELTRLRSTEGSARGSILASVAADVMDMESNTGSLEQYLSQLSSFKSGDDALSAARSAFLGTFLNRQDSCKKCCLLTDSHVVLKHQIEVFSTEFYPLPEGSVNQLDENLLNQLVKLEQEYARGVRSSKQKDVIRAESIIPEYSETVREFVSPGAAWEAKLSRGDVEKVLSLDGTIVNAEIRAKHIEETVRDLIGLYDEIDKSC